MGELDPLERVEPLDPLDLQRSPVPQDLLETRELLVRRPLSLDLQAALATPAVRAQRDLQAALLSTRDLRVLLDPLDQLV